MIIGFGVVKSVIGIGNQKMLLWLYIQLFSILLAEDGGRGAPSRIILYVHPEPLISCYSCHSPCYSFPESATSHHIDLHRGETRNR